MTRGMAVESICCDAPRAPSPVVHAPLHPFQLRMMHQMRRLETTPVTVKDGRSTPRGPYTPTRDTYEMMMGILSEARGGCMESTVLGHIANHPHRVRESGCFPTTMTYKQIMTRTVHVDLIDHAMPNLILVPASKLHLWTRELARFPTLRSIVFPHWTPRTHAKYTKEALQKLDVIVVSSNAVRPFVTSFITDFKSCVFTRVVVDEADEIDMGKCPWIHTAFTWLVSPRIDNLLDYSLACWAYDRASMTSVKSRGYVRSLLHGLHLHSDAMHELLDHVCLSSCEHAIDQDLGIRRTPMGFLPLPHTDFDDVIDIVATRMKSVLEDRLEPDADLLHDIACDAAHITARTIPEAIESAKCLCPGNERLNRADLPQILDEKTKGKCDMCLDEFDKPVFWPCCQNFSCIRCLSSIMEQTTFQTNHMYPWSVRCPFCRQSTATRNMSVISNALACKTPEYASPLWRILDHVVSGDKRTIVFSAVSETVREIRAFFEMNGLSSRVLGTKPNEMDAHLNALKRGDIDALLWDGRAELGFDFEADVAIGVDMSICDFEDMTEKHRFVPREKPGEKRKRTPPSKESIFLIRSDRREDDFRERDFGEVVYDLSRLDVFEDDEDAGVSTAVDNYLHRMTLSDYDIDSASDFDSGASDYIPFDSPGAI